MNDPYLQWKSINTPPPLDDGSAWGYMRQSVPVLGLYYDGRQAVITCSQYVVEDDEEPEDIVWRTECSEGWDVTDSVIGWVYLPPYEDFIKNNIQKK